MVDLIVVSGLERSIKSVFLIGLILLVRKSLNIKSIKSANIFLWTILLVYLLFPYSILITIKEPSQYGLLQIPLKVMLLIDEHSILFAKEFGYLLSRLNRSFIASLCIIYTVIKARKMNKSMKNSLIVEKDNRIKDCLNLFKLKRTVDIFVNDEIRVPITYGVMHPKIILQSHILKDDKLLKYVLIHELTHIKKFDIIFNHVKNLVACLYWHNIFILAITKYVDDDIEMLCDKLVIQKIGDTAEHRKEYCLSMLKLVEENEKKNKLVLKLHPTMERMVVMKKWGKSIAGVFALVLVMALSITVFVDVRAEEHNRVTSSVAPSKTYINADNRVKVITEEEYKNLSLGEIVLEERAENINEKVSLKGLTNKQYKFNMSSLTEPAHDGFTVNMSEVSFDNEIDYAIIIQENGNVIYQESCDKAMILTMKVYPNNNYKVTINNQSINSLTYIIKINSYIR